VAEAPHGRDAAADAVALVIAGLREDWEAIEVITASCNQRLVFAALIEICGAHAVLLQHGDCDRAIAALERYLQNKRAATDSR